MASLPLSGIRVVDYCWAVAGPVTAKYLAIMGAEVIKIESRARLDGGRLGNPFIEGKPGVNKSGYFATHSPSKMSIRLDISKPEAQALIRRLVETADIVSESFSTKVLREHNLHYDEMKKLKPDIIMISLTMQGQTGPFAHHVGFGRTLGGLAGVDNLTGWPNSNPAAPNQPYTDLIVPWFAVSAVIAALRHRSATGRGQYIDMSQLEASEHFLEPAILDYFVNGRSQKRVGNRTPGAAPHNVYPCRGFDRWVAIAVMSDAMWSSLCRAMGMPALAADERFATLLARKRHEEALDRIIGEWTQPQTVEEVVSKLREAGVSTGVVARGEDLHSDAQLRHRGHLRI
ncbi:MAG: CoA transferase, partial [Chloroflexi bacterium]|nr:CoA transferase [Chloroflexota bacterium]